MKHFRRPLALMLALLLAGQTSTALAASKKPSKTFTEVPTVKFTDIPGGTDSGDMDNMTLSASLPGFLDLFLLDENGSVVLTLADGMEIHSKETTFDYYAVNDEGELLTPGKYTFAATLVSQFGVESKETVSKATEVEEPKDWNAAAEAAAKRKAAAEGVILTEEEVAEAVKVLAAPAQEADASDAKEAADSDVKETASAKDSSKKTAAPKATATPKPSDDITYAEGAYQMGDEGLMIGVGVSDTAVQDNAGYWSLSADATDAEIWSAITRTMTGVDVDESESAYIYNSPEKGREKIGTVSGISQGLNLIAKRDDGWALVEAFRNEDGAFVRGYIKADKLRTTEPNPTYGIVIDKKAQTLTVYKEGVRLGSCKVTTGLATPKYPHRETPAGEFILVTRRGSYEYYGMGYTKYTIRVNGSYYLAEIPTTKKNGSKFLEIEQDLGTKATRGSICVAHDASTDGGINAEWIWNMTDENKRVKVLIFDDKPRTDVPVSAK